jgi:hypothetical protein
METFLPYRVVRLEGEEWTIRPDEGKLLTEEIEELKAYFEKIGLAFRIQHGEILVPGSIAWDVLYENLTQFYAGRAEVCPF